MSRIKFMNIEVDNLTMNETLLAIDDLIQKKNNAYVVTPNVDHIVKLKKDARLQASYANADLILADGKPLVWVSRIYRKPIKEKVSGSDLFPNLCMHSAQKGYRMFFLGAKEGVALRAAARLKEMYPGLEVVDCYSPPMGFEKNPEELEKIFEKVHNAKPDILILALGCPKQEYLAYELKDKMNVPITFCLGATLDFAAGNVKRAPRWMADAGLEWLFRIMQEPRRMFKRYILEDWKFAFMFIRYLFKSF